MATTMATRTSGTAAVAIASPEETPSAACSKGCRWVMLRPEPKRRFEDAIARRSQGQLCCGKNLREVVPGANQPWGLREAWVAGWLA